MIEIEVIAASKTIWTVWAWMHSARWEKNGVLQEAPARPNSDARVCWRTGAQPGTGWSLWCFWLMLDCPTFKPKPSIRFETIPKHPEPTNKGPASHSDLRWTFPPHRTMLQSGLRKHPMDSNGAVGSHWWGCLWPGWWWRIPTLYRCTPRRPFCQRQRPAMDEITVTRNLYRSKPRNVTRIREKVPLLWIYSTANGCRKKCH